jgi:sugar O-acyltransferase (sialic acid O-acetyltransferase NeuD family)
VSERVDAAVRRGVPSLLIFPCNGNALEALDCLGEAYQLEAFVDDTPAKQAAGLCGYRVLSRSAFTEFPEARVLAVPGSASSYRSRRAVIESLQMPDARFASVIHPSARVSPLAKIGQNVLIMAGVVVTSNAVIGNHVCILPNTVVHHDAVIGRWTLIGSNCTIAGGTVLRENCYIGSGSSIMNGVQIGSRALVGLGSNVIRNVAPEAKVAGNPAREI